MNHSQQQIKIGQTIKQARISAGLSYYKLTKLTGVNFNIIKSIESGTSNYTISSLIALESILHSGIINENIFTDN